MSTIAISFTSSASTVYNFVLDKFIEDNLPRSYAESNNFSFSVSGSAILTGPAYNQRHIWAISTPLANATAESFDDMYKAWDADRADGLGVALGLIDSTFGTSITTNAVFSTAPSYQKFGPAMMIVSFGLTEI
jgi:hypothetical protein